MRPATRTFVACYVILAVMTLPVSAAERSAGIYSVDPRGEAPTEGADADPRRIVNARLPPYTAIGRFKGTMTCTAAIVLDPRIIVTAGHCVTDRNGTIKRSGLSFRLAYQTGTDLGRFEAMLWAVGSTQSFKRQSAHDAARDWAILVLDRAAEAVQPFRLSQRSVATLKSLDGQLFLPSYSNDVGDAEVLSVDPACSIHDLLWEVLIHDCKARPGSSGAPLLLRDGSRHALVGIHTGSMFASDEEGHVAEYVGNRAIGSWAFNETLLALSQLLNGQIDRDAASAVY